MQRNPAASPPARISHALAYDAARQRIVLFGGYDPLNPAYFGDTWEWDGSNWKQRIQTDNPPARAGHALAYDAVRQHVVLFGGGAFAALNDTWEWDGRIWIQHTPATSPPGRTVHALVYDAARRRIVLFGGGRFNDTWEYATTILVTSGSSRIGSSQSLVLTAARDAGRPFLVGSSLGIGPIPVDTRRIDLSPDDLLRVSSGGLWPSVFSGYHGVLDGKGQATASIHIPNNPVLIGTRIHTAFVTLDPASPSGVRSISNTETFTIT